MIRRITTTRWNYWLGFLVDGITAFSMLYFVLQIPGSDYLRVLAFLISGIFIFSLVEYLIHAKLFHAKPGSIFKPFVLGHIAHHKDPQGYDSLPFFFASVLLLIFALIVSFFLSATVGFSTAAGILLGYIGYGLLHFLIHHYQWKGGYMKYLQVFHEMHHLKPRTNMGVSSPLWDYIFRTKQ